MAEALHREVEELKGILDAGFAFMEASKVCVHVRHANTHSEPLPTFSTNRVTSDSQLHKFYRSTCLLCSSVFFARNWSRRRSKPRQKS